MLTFKDGFAMSIKGYLTVEGAAQKKAITPQAVRLALGQERLDGVKAGRRVWLVLDNKKFRSYRPNNLLGKRDAPKM